MRRRDNGILRRASLAQDDSGYLGHLQAYVSFLNTLGEAARLNGATNFQVFWNIHMPLFMPIIVYTALTSFT